MESFVESGRMPATLRLASAEPHEEEFYVSGTTQRATQPNMMLDINHLQQIALKGESLEPVKNLDYDDERA